MKLADAAVAALIKTCAGEKRDTFFVLPPPVWTEISALAGTLDARVLTLLPGTVYPCGHTEACVLNTTQDLPEAPRTDVIFADIRLAGDPGFAAYIASYGLRYILLPFYEAALLSEYGYKFSYRQLAELRAELPFHVHILGVSPEDRTETEIYETLGTRAYAVIGEKTERKLCGVQTENENGKFRLAAGECEKSPYKKQIFLCATRTEAEHLRAFFSSWGVKAALFHGGLSKDENASALRQYAAGETTALIATKSLLPSYPFLYADKVFYCGLPYSFAHADRCASLGGSGTLTCFWCDADADILSAQTAAFAAALQITDPAFLQKRAEQLSELRRYLEAHS